MVSDRDPLALDDTQPRTNSKINSFNYQNSRELYPELLQNQLDISDTTATSNWENTIEKCIKSIVSIKYCRTRGLDTEFPGSFTASGFVVDSQLGIILSNRHVVSISPIKAYAVLCNYEEIELKPIYRDPVHDFGFFQYDPCKVRFLDIPSIELYPEGAKIGQDIRVVGNDAGEKLSISSGTLARLDREAPDYGIGEYNDFNTFYYQAASSTSSGSSGSPVLDVLGRAIALNAGGASTSSTSYYLPLDRVSHALKMVQKGKTISRGTLQVTFEYQSYDRLLQLGLSCNLEKKLRSQQQHQTHPEKQANEGLLVVKSVLPDGPAVGYLEPGDILLTCNSKLLPQLFIDLEGYLDEAIDKNTTITIMVSRAGELKEFSLSVQDLQCVTPSRYLEFGGGVLNDLSYQMARSYGLSLQNPGVYVGAAGFILGTARALRKSIIVGINNKQVKSMDDFIEVISCIDQGERVPIRYYSLSRPMKVKVMIIYIDWRWHRMRWANRNDKTGYWDYQVLETPIKNESLICKDQIHLKYDTIGVKEEPIKALTSSIVAVDCQPPFVIDGSKNAHSYGAGIIVSMNPPMIVCDRDTVLISIAVISLTFDNSLTISADLVFLHPYYNFAILTFDPAPVIKANIKIEAAELADIDFHVGDTVTYVGLSGRNEINIKQTTISSFGPIRTTETLPPRWRATNVEAFKVSDGNLASQGGLFADKNGKVAAIWVSFSIDNERHELSSILGGIPSKLIMPTIKKIKSKERPIVKGIDAEFWTLQVANARIIGVSDTWIEKIHNKAAASGRHPSVVYVLGITDMSSSSGRLLKAGDIVLAINGITLTSISQLADFTELDLIQMTLLRDGQEQDLNVPTTSYNGKETTEVIGWQGMLVQTAYTAAKAQVQKYVPAGIYVSCCQLGSPAQATLNAGVWITEVNQIPVKTLQEFLDVVTSNSVCKQRYGQLKNVAPVINAGSIASLFLASPTKQEYEENLLFSSDQQSHIQIKFENTDNITRVKAIKLDGHYWPTWHLKRNESSIHGWTTTFY